MPRNIHSRLEDLERRTPKPRESPQRTEAGRMLFAFLDEYKSRKVSGTLTVEDEEIADAIKAEVKRRRDAGSIGGGASVG